MVNKVEDRIKSVMSAVFEISADQIKEDSSPDTIESWDSLKHMNLIVALEEEFLLRINDEQTLEMLNYSLIYMTIKEMLK